MTEINLFKPQNIYIARDLYDKYYIFFDEPSLEIDGKFYSSYGMWVDLNDYMWDLNKLEPGTYLKYTLNN